MTAQDEALEVWIDQDLCTGDGICAQYAPEVFELDIDGLAYVKSADDELLQDKGATTPVPLPLLNDVRDSAKECLATASTYAALRTRWRSTARTRSSRRVTDHTPSVSEEAGSSLWTNFPPFHCHLAGTRTSGQQRGTPVEE